MWHRLALAAAIVVGTLPACASSPAPDAEGAAFLDGEMSVVPSGWFTMGSAAARRNEGPEHQVWLDEFEIDVYEVTVAQYAAFVAETGWRLPGDWRTETRHPAGNLPVTHVAWPDAAAYCEWAGKRLPTEAEWEKAARGTDERRYPWGNEWDGARAAVSVSVETGPVPVGSYPEGASPYGALDMAGNVHEWVADFYDPGY